MPRLRQVVIDTTHARMSAEFWRQLLGLAYRDGQEQPGPGQDDPAGEDWLNLVAPDGSPRVRQREAISPGVSGRGRSETRLITPSHGWLALAELPSTRRPGSGSLGRVRCNFGLVVTGWPFR